MAQDFSLHMCVHVSASVCVCLFVCVSMQMKQKGRRHLSGWDSGGGVGVETNTPFVVFLACITTPAGDSFHLVQFGAGAKCASSLCSKVIW